MTPDKKKRYTLDYPYITILKPGHKMIETGLRGKFSLNSQNVTQLTLPDLGGIIVPLCSQLQF